MSFVSLILWFPMCILASVLQHFCPDKPSVLCGYKDLFGIYLHSWENRVQICDSLSLYFRRYWKPRSVGTATLLLGKNRKNRVKPFLFSSVFMFLNFVFYKCHAIVLFYSVSKKAILLNLRLTKLVNYGEMMAKSLIPTSCLWLYSFKQLFH